MSALILAQTVTAISPNLPVSFLASGGTAPYAYSVHPGGAGGTISSSTGLYTAPVAVSPDPAKLFDTVQVRDALGAIVTAQILVGTPLLLFCDIVQSELALAQGRVYLWDQKIFQPTDFGLYVAVSVPSCKPFANTTRYDGSGAGLDEIKTINTLATVDLDIISRGVEARDRKEEVIMAFNSTYSQSQQETNSFYIGKLPPGARFLNLSNLDGAAIPYRYRISVNLQYAVTKKKAVAYYDTFSATPVTTNP